MNCARQTTTTVTSQWRSTVVPGSAEAVEVRSVMRRRRGGVEGQADQAVRMTVAQADRSVRLFGPAGPYFRTGWSISGLEGGTVHRDGHPERDPAARRRPAQPGAH